MYTRIQEVYIFGWNVSLDTTPVEVEHAYELLIHLLCVAPAPNDASFETFEGILYN